MPVVASAVLLSVVLMRVPLREIWAAFAAADPGFVLLGIGLQAVIALLSAERTYHFMVAFGLRLTRNQVRNTLLGTNFYSLVMPGQLPGALVSLRRYYVLGADLAPAAAALTLSRLCEVLAFVLLGMGFALFEIPEGRYGMLLAALILGVLVTALTGRWLAAHFQRMRAYLPQVRRLAPLGIAMGVLHVFLATLAMQSFAVAVGIQLAYGTVLWMTTCIYLVTLLPLSVSGIGVRDASLIVLTAPFGVSAPIAVAWSFLILGGRVVIGLTGGVLELIRWRGSSRGRRVSRDV